ncbi:flp pilus assembly protein TadG [Pandoraea horticolens]|uniref:Flp pilus assembly protein TadG n=1 Tax=Pandoraea horticolens TaxID=2508298 RepID=A0A5E4YKL5_9BURK|nr:TadE/TadG family type IV pilus assembly protein [Pandoraea horticolens]VVE49314.1 flp pilus assembly protein TadG [Pandoraea horticolens]
MKPANFLCTGAGRHRQRGAAVVEFALVAALFITLLIGIMEFARILFYWNTAVEAARLGARVAVVCDVNAAAVKNRMTNLMPQLADANIQISYVPAGCDATSCTLVTVSYTGLTFKTFVPFVPLSLPLPAFATTLPRESLSSATGNNVCS